jgi:hypothetical protein
MVALFLKYRMVDQGQKNSSIERDASWLELFD